MQPWPGPAVPALPGRGPAPRVWDTSAQAVMQVGSASARMYVCGITPYDATHLGHAATYVAFDLLHRGLLDAGHDFVYVQNVTYVDDMSALGALAPHVYLGAVEAIPLVVDAVEQLIEAGHAYRVPTPDAEHR